jgi:hypothetical protein
VQNDAAKFLGAKNWRLAAGYKSNGRKRQGRPWPEHGPKTHTKRKKKKKNKKTPNGYFSVYQTLIN